MTSVEDAEEIQCRDFSMAMVIRISMGMAPVRDNL
jgi:hypothetical protein